MDLTLRLAVDRAADRDVRSAATHLATSSVAIAEGLSDPVSAFGRSADAVEGEVVPMVRRAIDVGLTPEVEAFAKEFMTAVRKR